MFIQGIIVQDRRKRWRRRRSCGGIHDIKRQRVICV
jgi:hypothetical protein